MNAVLKPAPTPIFPKVSGELLDEKAMLDLLGDPIRQGHCDLCGRWDGSLKNGIGGCCAESAIVNERPVKRAQQLKMLPANAHFWTGLCKLQAALFELNDERCIIERIELGSQLEPVIHLSRAPGEGVVNGRHELFAGTGLHRQRIVRASFSGCTVQWRP